MLNIVINIYFTPPYYADIMLNAFNDPLCSTGIIGGPLLQSEYLLIILHFQVLHVLYIT